MEPMINIALRAAREAGRIITHAFDHLYELDIESKGPNDFVTEVDRNAESAIARILKKAYPSHDLLGEEGGLQQSGSSPSSHLWIIDPLDGTHNFIQGIPHFAVSIACQKEGRLLHAVVYDPIKNEEFWATRGGGSYLNSKRIRVSSKNNLEGAVVATGFPLQHKNFEGLRAFQSMYQGLANKVSAWRSMGASTLNLAYVACGRFDAFWDAGLGSWDLAAGSLLITEAGGLVGDWQGGHQYLEKGEIVSANPKCFREVLKSLKVAQAQ